MLLFPLQAGKYLMVLAVPVVISLLVNPRLRIIAWPCPPPPCVDFFYGFERKERKRKKNFFLLFAQANLIFLCNIVRVLITKVQRKKEFLPKRNLRGTFPSGRGWLILLQMRATNSREEHHTKKAVRATLILVPLLGLQYILFPFRPDESTAGPSMVFAYDIASAVFTSLQVQKGFFFWEPRKW